MRNGDAYKIGRMVKNGTPNEEIIARFKWSYSEEEMKKFLPKAKPKAKPKTVVKTDPLG